MSSEPIEGSNLLAVALKELEFVQAEIARFDKSGLTIKSWSIVSWSGLMAFAVETDAWSVALLAGAAVLAFAYLELTYRRFQARFIARAGEIESSLSRRSLDDYEYRLGRCALISDGRKELFRCLRLPHFSVFYSLLVLLAIVVALQI